MTRAYFSESCGIYCIYIHGHAQHHENGPDIVCAACSMLTCLLDDIIRSSEQSGAFQFSNVEIDDDARFRAEFLPHPHANDQIRAVVDTIARGFEMLALQYPDNVQYKENTV